MSNRELQNQISDLIKKYFDEVSPTTDEMTAVEEDLRNDPEQAVAYLCYMNTPTTSLNMLYMSSAVNAERRRKHND
jgi:hypothetical protein